MSIKGQYARNIRESVQLLIPNSINTETITVETIQ